MTMNVRITNVGPAPYVALVTRGTTLVATLQPGESTEQYTWNGGDPLQVSEKGV